MRQKWISILLIVSMVIGMTACSDKKTGTLEDDANVQEVESEEVEETTAYVFGFTCISMEDPFFITLEGAVRQSVEEQGSTLITKDPARNQDTQNQQISEMIDQGINAIFLCPVDWEKIQPSLENLKAHNVKILNIDTQVKAYDYVDAFIGTDNVSAGEMVGQDLVERCPDGGKIVILESPFTNSVNERITGFETAVAEKGFEVAARENADGDLNEALSVMNDFLSGEDDIVAVVCGNDPMALGALVAVNAMNAKRRTEDQKTIWIYGVGGSPDLKKELKKDNTMIAGSAAQSPVNMGKNATVIAFAMLDGEEYEKETFEETFFIDKDNVDLYGVDGWQ